MTEVSPRPALPVARLSRGTLQDHVHEQLCEWILNGEIAPGQMITMQSIADAFGVSPMPVREALQRLSAAKVLTVISGRSIGVPPLSAERMLDLRRVRMEVESLAATWAAARITEAELGQLDELLRQMAQAALNDSRKDYVRLNRAYHFAIYRAAGSDVLMAIIENLWLQISPYFHLLHASGNFIKSNEQHQLMLDGLRAHDGAIVSQAIRNDLDAASRVLAELLDKETG